MKTATIIIGASAIVLLLLVLAAGQRGLESDADPATVATPATITPIPAIHEGLLYGRITAVDGAVYEGRMRFGGDEEALWGNYFNGFKDENPWVVHVPNWRAPIKILGIEIPTLGPKPNIRRPFMARFGDIARIESRGRDIQVTLKSGTMLVLDRLSADDFADGLRVWDEGGSVLNLGERRIRMIEYLPTPSRGDAPYPLHGTVRTPQGDFTGLIQWNRKETVGTDALDGQSVNGDLSLTFNNIRTIERRSLDSSLVTLLDGQEIVLFGTREVSQGNLGIYVDDQRYGRVLISWDVFERVDFSRGGTGPAYGDFPPGRPLTGSVTTRSGRRLTGRLVFDLDESETTETLDAPSRGVDYTILFGLIASIVPTAMEGDIAEGVMVNLHSGETLRMEPAGDLSTGNGGMLIFIHGGPLPEYVPWTDVERIDFDRPPEMYPTNSPR